MTNSQRLAAVRSRLLHWLTYEADHRGQGETCDVTIESESLLIRDEFYCGRRFRTADHHAVWFIEEDELKIYRRSGELVCVLDSTGIDQIPATPTAEDSDQSTPEILRMPTPTERKKSLSERTAAQQPAAAQDQSIRRAA